MGRAAAQLGLEQRVRLAHGIQLGLLAPQLVTLLRHLRSSSLPSELRCRGEESERIVGAELSPAVWQRSRGRRRADEHGTSFVEVQTRTVRRAAHSASALCTRSKPCCTASWRARSAAAAVSRLACAKQINGHGSRPKIDAAWAGSC